MNISKSVRRFLTVLAAAIWASAIVGGFVWIGQYSSTAGSATEAPTVWPASSGLHRSEDRHTLVMFVHTHCSCSRASLTELNNLLHRVHGRVSAIVVFIRPEGVESDLVEISLRTHAGNLPDALVVDDDGTEERLFGTQTSGATLLFDPSGTLMFSGGLTSARGHEGDSFGQEQIVALIMTGAGEGKDSPVFGCELEEEERGP